MREARSPFAKSQLLCTLYAIGLVTIPFDSVNGISALGELGFELSFPVFAAAIALGLWMVVVRGSGSLFGGLAPRVAAAALTLIFLSFAVNSADILTTVFRERSGINKFATSLMVLLYGFALAWLTEQIDEDRLLGMVARFISWSAAIATFYLLIELAGRAGLLGGAFDAIDGVIHTRQADIINPWNGTVNAKVLYDWDERLRSVSFEPPAFGNYTGFAWPWLIYAAVNAPAERKLRSWAMAGAFTIAILACGSRTGLMMLASNLFVMAMLAWLYARRGSTTEAAAAVRLLTPFVLAVLLGLAGLWAAGRYQAIVAGLVQGDSVSNISRFGFQMAAVQMFLSHPLLGIGLGQFGFHVVDYLPSWIFRSPEVAPMITFPTAPWPNVYSVYGRLAAELGAAGVIGWLLLWLGLAARLASRARHLVGGDRPSRFTAHYPVAMNCIGVLMSGIATDTFRTPMIWISLGLACGLLSRSRRGVSARRAWLRAAFPRRLPQ